MNAMIRRLDSPLLVNLQILYPPIPTPTITVKTKPKYRYFLIIIAVSLAIGLFPTLYPKPLIIAVAADMARYQWDGFYKTK